MGAIPDKIASHKKFKWFLGKLFTMRLCVLFTVVFVPTTASTESPAATVDSETITLNSGTLQAFEILPVSNTSQKRKWSFYA